MTTGAGIRKVAHWLRFRGSASYWESRYRSGKTSGPGSYGDQAMYKATFLNDFVAEHEIRSVIEFGSGDGNQLGLANYPSYLGLDVSETAVRMSLDRFQADTTKGFALYRPELFRVPSGLLGADLVLSLDVVYHLIEDDVFDRYMHHLFAAATRFVILYATDEDSERLGMVGHVRHRAFSRWIRANAPDWSLVRTKLRPKPEFQDFFVYRKDAPE